MIISEFLSRGNNLLLFTIILPLIFALAVKLSGNKDNVRSILTVLGSVANLIFAVGIFKGESFASVHDMTGMGLEMRLVLTDYSSLFIVLAAVAFAVITLYCTFWLKGKKYAGLLMMYLFISLAMINGTFEADNMGIMLFFWEGLLCTLFGSLLIGNTDNYKAAFKALTLSGLADLLLMFGIIITVHLAGTAKISEMHGLEVSGLGWAGFGCLMLGALGKAGCMPFHSWIPVAADDAPLPFMAAFPGALEKLVGFYLAVRVMTDIYDVSSGSAASVAVMTLGAVTLICAVAMALVQKDMKKLLSYHAVSQVGYMVLGIGSALPVGIAGGLFHMFNNVIYKSALFMVAGIIENKAGTTDLRKLSGLGKKMPVTMLCFTFCGLSIAGVPPFNGFFSKELIFEAALESECSFNYVFYAAALVGAFMTAVSFLKMGRGAFSGELRLPEGMSDINEKGLGMKLPPVIMSLLCLVFGLFNRIPVDGLFGVATKTDEKFGGWPSSPVLVIISVCVLLLALCDHIYGCKKTGKPINAADHIHYAPILRNVYALAEKGVFDPYNRLTDIMNGFAFVCVTIEKGISFIYDKAAPGAVRKLGDDLHKADNGSLSRYIVGVCVGLAALLLLFLAKLLKF